MVEPPSLPNTLRLMTQSMLEFDGVSHAYGPGEEALRGVSFRLDRGDRTALVGANGAGKSTLLLHVNGLLLPSTGQVRIMGMPVDPAHINDVRRAVGFVFQQADDQLFMPTVEEDVAFGPRNMGLSQDEVGKRVRGALREMNLDALRRRAPYTLSAGEKRRAAIASVLSMQPEFWVMDEPTSGLDPRSRRAFMALVAQIAPTLLLATHDLDMAWELCPQTIVLYRGRIEAEGPTRELLADAALMERCGLELPYSAR